MSIAPPVVESQDPAAVGAWYALFIQTFPEFSNTTTYPQATVSTWIVPAVEMLDQCRFGAQYNLAVCLYVAHNVVLAARNAAAAAKGIVGTPTSLTSSKTIDKLSISFDVNATLDKNAAWFNLTTYGQQLYQMLKSFNTGPMYVGYRGSRTGLNYGAWRSPYAI